MPVLGLGESTQGLGESTQGLGESTQRFLGFCCVFPTCPDDGDFMGDLYPIVKINKT